MHLHTINSGHYTTIDVTTQGHKYRREVAKVRRDIYAGKQHFRLHGYRIYATVNQDGAIFTISSDNRVQLVTGFLYLTPEESQKIKDVATGMVEMFNTHIMTPHHLPPVEIKEWHEAPSLNIFIHPEPALWIVTGKKTKFNGLPLERAMRQVRLIETIIAVALAT